MSPPTPTTTRPVARPERGSARRRGVVSDFDFTAPPRMSREHTRLLEISFETFARQWANQLSSRLRCDTSVTLAGVAQEAYDSFAASLASPSLLLVFSPDGKGQPTSVVALAPELALAHLDRALGGPGGEQPKRELTEVEVAITQGMIDRALGSLNYAFASVTTLAPRIDGVLQDPQLLQVARANDMMLISTFSVNIGGHHDTVRLMMPLAPLQQALAEASQREIRSLEELSRARENAALVAAGVAEVPVDVSFRLNPMTTAPGSVLKLAVGDLIRFTHGTDRPVKVMAGGTAIGSAVVTTRGNRRACLIVNPEES